MPPPLMPLRRGRSRLKHHPGTRRWAGSPARIQRRYLAPHAQASRFTSDNSWCCGETVAGRHAEAVGNRQKDPWRTRHLPASAACLCSTFRRETLAAGRSAGGDRAVGPGLAPTARIQRQGSCIACCSHCRAAGGCSRAINSARAVAIDPDQPPVEDSTPATIIRPFLTAGNNVQLWV